MKKKKPFQLIRNEEIPFDIPDNWVFTKLGYISTYGEAKQKINARDANNNLWMLDLEDIAKGGTLLCKKRVFERKAIGDKTIFEKGSILYSKLRPYLLKILIADEDGICTPELVPFKMYGGINTSYIALFLKSPYVDSEINKVTYGVKMPRVGTKTMVNFYVPLPPIEEQQRIVDRVNELMAKIDEYEKLENQLVQLKEQFPKDMRDSLLQAGMKGMLTEQLTTESNAFQLADKIKNERRLLGKNRYVTDNYDEENRPETWALIKSGECFSLEKGKKVLDVQLPYLEAKYLRGKTSAKIMNSGEFVSKGTEVILVDGENSGEVFIEPEDGILGSTFKVLFIPKHINKKFALYFLNMNRDLFRSNKKGAAIPHLNKEIFNDLTMPIPPIEEQQRIVDKLDEMLPLVDALAQMD